MPNYKLLRYFCVSRLPNNNLIVYIELRQVTDNYLQETPKYDHCFSNLSIKQHCKKIISVSRDS